MELLTQMIGHILIREDARIDLSEMAWLLEEEAVRALVKIQGILRDDTLSDFECVERIVRVFEEMGGDGGNRHDFG